MYFRRVLVCETWEFKAFTFSKWSTRRTLKEKMRGFSLPPPLWTWSWTLWGPGPGCSDDAGRRLSGAFPLDSSVIKPQCSEQSCHKPLREIKLPPLFFFLSFLARHPTRGHHSREIRGSASTPQRGQQLCPTLALLVTIQAPTLLILSN